MIGRISIDVTKAAPNGGKPIALKSRYLAVVSVPPGAQLTISFDTDASPIPVARPRAWRFDDCASRTAYVFWKTLDDTPQSGPVRGTIEMEFSDDIFSLPPVERVETLPAPADAFQVAQGKIAATGTAVQAYGGTWATEEVMVTAAADNAAALTVGFSAALTNVVDGTGNGDFLAPGAVKTYPVDRLERLYLNGTMGDRWSICSPRQRR